MAGGFEAGRWRSARLMAFVVAGLAGWSQSTADEVLVSPVAVFGQTAPAGGVYNLFGDIDVDRLRRVTFTASLSSGRNGLFRTRRGRPEALLLGLQPAPPDAGTVWHLFFESAGNAAGDVAFIGTVLLPSREGVFRWRAGDVTTLALSGEPAPTRRGEIFSSFDQVRILENGDVYFSATLSTPPTPTQPPLPAGRAVVRAAAEGGLEAVISPGDRYMGLREIAQTLQYDVNESGEVATQAIVVDAELLQQTDLSEIVLYSAGRLRTLASEDLSVTGGVDLVRNFAVTFDQVHINEAGTASFYAGTNDFPLGAYFLNRAGGFLSNQLILGEGDPSPISPTDEIRTLGAFGLAGDESIVFHAITRDVPRGGALLARHPGGLTTVARTGDPRPDGLGPWHGFLMMEMNARGAFAFTDFQNSIVQVGVFLGRFVPEPDLLVEEMIDTVRSSSAEPSLQTALVSRLTAMSRTLERAPRPALRQAEALRHELGLRTGRGLPDDLVEILDSLTRDLIQLLGGPSAHGVASGSAGGSGSRPAARRHRGTPLN